MRYMIFDTEGNAIDAFRTRGAANAALRGMVRMDPEAADELVLIEYDDAGRPTGETLRASELTPSVAMQPTPWVFVVATGAALENSSSRPKSRDLNTYLPGRSEQARVRWTDDELVPTG